MAETPTGLDAARAIRERYEVPIIFYFARGDVVLRNEVARMGNAELLRKPAPEKARHETLASLLSFKAASA